MTARTDADRSAGACCRATTGRSTIGPARGQQRTIGPGLSPDAPGPVVIVVCLFDCLFVCLCVCAFVCLFVHRLFFIVCCLLGPPGPWAPSGPGPVGQFPIVALVATVAVPDVPCS